MIYDLKLKNYREHVQESHPSIDASAKRSKMVNGAETVTTELKQLNDEYKSILDRLIALLNQLQDDESKLREFVSSFDVYFDDNKTKVYDELSFDIMKCVELKSNLLVRTNSIEILV